MILIWKWLRVETLNLGSLEQSSDLFGLYAMLTER